MIMSKSMRYVSREKNFFFCAFMIMFRKSGPEQGLWCKQRLRIGVRVRQKTERHI